MVLQQGPSSLDDSRILFRRGSARFDQRIRAAGARTALFSVWPESARRSAFPAVLAIPEPAASVLRAAAGAAIAGQPSSDGRQ